MKRYRFALESVRRVRRIHEDQAKAALLGANRRLGLARRELEARLARYNATARTPSAMTVEEFVAERRLRQYAAETVVEARGQVRLASEAAAMSLSHYTLAARKVQVLDRLDERRRAEHALEASREETREVDDIVVGRYRRSR